MQDWKKLDQAKSNAIEELSQQLSLSKAAEDQVLSLNVLQIIC